MKFRLLTFLPLPDSYEFKFLFPGIVVSFLSKCKVNGRCVRVSEMREGGRGLSSVRTVHGRHPLLGRRAESRKEAP